MAEEWYIAAPVAAHPADRGHVFVFNRSTGRSDVLQGDLFRVLRQADRFQTITAHVRTLLAAGWEDDRTGFLESAHRELISRGLLVSRSAFEKCLLETGGRSDSPPAVTSVIFPTRDRIAQLQRCVGGFIQNIEKHGRSLDYLVFDDSRVAGQGVEVQRVLAPFAASGARVFYAGREEKLAFLRELVRAGSAEGLPESVVSFCLFGDGGSVPTYGVNRNAALLATAGELVVTTDDDTVYEPVAVGTQGKVLQLTSDNDPTILRFHADRAELVAAFHPSDLDIVSCHEKLLGRSVLQCQSSLGADSPIEVEGIGPGLADSICRRPMLVRATMSGFWGDSGMGSPNAALELRGESRNLAMRSEADYGHATVSREVFRSVPCYTVSEGALFMTTNAGLDNRSLLPPFLPVGRNEDGVFAMAMRVCAPDALIGHVPLALFHAPAEMRRNPPGAFLNVTPRIADLVGAVIRSFPPSSWVRDPAERLTGLGKHFADLGALDLEDFERQITIIWTATASSYIGYLENLLDVYHGHPEYWARDVRSIVGNFKDFITRGCAAVPRELSEVRPVEQAKLSCRRLVREFGELLQWWPCIWNAARTLRADGIRLALPATSSSA